MLHLTYEYKAKPTIEQVQMIEHTQTVCRKVGNFALHERKDRLNSRKCVVNACSLISEDITSANTLYPNNYEQANSLTRAKINFPELTSVHTQVLQQVLRKLETVFVNMKRQGIGFPRFKNQHQMISFVYPQMRRDQPLKGNPIKLPQLGWMESVNSRLQGFYFVTVIQSLQSCLF